MTVGMVTACPKCDNHRLQSNTGSDMIGKRDAPRYRCRECGAGFDEPNRRPPRNSQNGNVSGLAKQLEEASPDEVSAP